ncbi:hypothetical protein ACQ4PT_050846 [Festuca glaucescens]
METITDRSSQSRPAPPASPWAGLPRDLLAEISTHLCDAVDFVRFHAVCRPWREAAPPLLSPASAYPRMRPWLLALCNDLFLHLPINDGCSLLSRKTPSYRHGYDGVVLPGAGASSTGNTNLVASADGTAAWLFRAHTEPTLTLVDLLTGTLTRLPRLPTDAKMNRWMDKWRGIVYRDGTVFMYIIVLEEHRFFDLENTSTFIAAILRTGDAAWKLVKKRLDWKTSSHSSVVYQDRKILACEGGRFGLLLDLDFGSNDDDDRGDGWISWRSVWDSRVETKYNHENYVFELHRENYALNNSIGCIEEFVIQ